MSIPRFPRRTRAPIFRADDDCLRFLGVVEDAVGRFGIEVHAYSLMPNHCHLLVRSVRGNLSRAMRHVNAVYTPSRSGAKSWMKKGQVMSDS